jgi:hypothetical protein
MASRRIVPLTMPRRRHKAVVDELLIAPRKRHGRRSERVAFQWHDGAGELHYCVLSPAQSWPYLVKD